MTIAGCAPVAPTPGVVVFNAAEFLALYPEFTAVNTASAATLPNNFTNATLILNNSCCSRVCDAPTRQTLLYLLTAHLTAVFQGVNNAGAAGIVGRISQAAEGSVNVSAEWSSTVGQSQAFYLTTNYGTLFWQMTANFRNMVYVAPPPPNFGPWPLYGGPGMGWGAGGGYPWGGCGAPC
jgi:hypothetical protein